jgi:hypothetical protein
MASQRFRIAVKPKPESGITFRPKKGGMQPEVRACSQQEADAVVSDQQHYDTFLIVVSTGSK